MVRMPPGWLDSVRVGRRLAGASVRGQMQYRVAFVLDIAGTTLLSVVELFEVLILFHVVTRLGDWSRAEVLFFFGLANISFALTDMIFGHLDRLHLAIKDGSFATLLTRPVSSLLQAMAGDFALRRLGRVALGVGTLAFALPALNVPWDLGRVVYLPLAVAAGIGIYGAIWICGAALTFWTTDTMEITNAFTYGGSLYASYPIDLFASWLRRIFMFGLPLAFVTYFPGLYILDRPDPLGFPRWVAATPPAVAVVALTLAGLLWRTAVRHYRGTGS